ncbi:MAG: TetR/AcrR family transcriptional regulator [Chitinophagales bacterium]|nr:TetR/AcrR family transcriptional regulator [Chitinophagales bacterium]
MNQKLKSELTQQLIIEKSFKLFYKNGFSKTSIPEIMQETGLSKGAFYHHFKNKNELGEKVISDIVSKRIYNNMIAPLNNYRNENVIGLLCRVFTERIQNFSIEEKEFGCPANNLINEIGCSDSTFRKILRQLINDWKAMLIEVLEYGKLKKEIRKNVNSSSVAIYLISGFEGVRGIRKVFDNDEILLEYLESMKSHISQLA